MPSSSASARWRSSIDASPASCAPPSAAANSFSSRSVMPLSAECTTSTRAALERRARTTAAMLRHVSREETLVPPNLSTIQEDPPRGAIDIPCVKPPRCRGPGMPAALAAGQPPSDVFVVEYVAQVFFEFAVRQHFFQTAPGRLAALTLRAHAFVDPRQ